MQINHVAGKNKGHVMLYSLSTCSWCRKTKKFLSDLGVEYDYVDVDLLEKTDKEKLMEDVKHWNPQCSFPTMVINDKKCVVGFNETKIKAELE